MLLTGGCIAPAPSWETWDRLGATQQDFARDLQDAEREFEVFSAISLNQPLPLHARDPFNPNRPQSAPLLDPFTALLGPALVNIHKPDFIADKMRQNGWRRRNGNQFPAVALAARNGPKNIAVNTPNPNPPAKNPILPVPDSKPVIQPPPGPPRLAVDLAALPDNEPKAKIVLPPKPPVANIPEAPNDTKLLEPIGTVTLAQPGTMTVMINAGRLKGIELEQRLQVQRRGKIIGELETGEIFRDISLCKILSSKTPIRAGDLISPANPKP